MQFLIDWCFPDVFRYKYVITKCHFCFHYLAFNLVTKAIVAGLNNQRIFTAIDAINQKIDELTFSLSLLDVEFATKLRNNSVEIGVSTTGSCVEARVEHGQNTWQHLSAHNLLT